MGLFGGESSGDGALIKLAIFCTVFSLIVTIGVANMYSSNADYDFDTVATERANLINFTGETVVSNTPWALTGVYTPWVLGTPYNLTSENFLYGSSIDDYPYLYSTYGKTTEIKLSADAKSAIPLSYGSQTAQVVQQEQEWYAKIGFLQPVFGFFGLPLTKEVTVEKDYSVWNYTGYRYEFDPMLPFNNGVSAADGKLSIVWYSNSDVDGISGGLVIYGNEDILLANIGAADIVNNYNVMSAYSTKYQFDFDGCDIYLNVRFDPDVVNSSADLEQAWKEGKWSIAITSPSAGNFLDVNNSNSFSSTIGNITTTFKQIFTFSLPNMGPYGNIIAWLFCSLPAEMALLLFCSKFGVAGIPAAILGNLLVLA